MPSMPVRGGLVTRNAIFSRKVRYDYLFEMETWIKGLTNFFHVANLPLAPEERDRVAIRNYVDEVGVARDAIQHVGRVCENLLGEEKGDFSSFFQYLEKQLLRGGNDPERVSSRLATAEAEIARAVETLQDTQRVFDELARSRYIGLSTFSAAGRVLVRSLAADRNLGVFLREDLFPVFDSADKRTLSRVLDRLTDRKKRRQLATLFVGLFKGLHYTQEASACIARPASRRRSLVLFSLITSLLTSLGDYIRRSLLDEEPSDSLRAAALERLLFSTEMESHKVMEGELVDVAHLKESRLAQERLENACGIFRDLFQQNILALAEAYTGPVDARRIFPDHTTRRQQSLALREDLWRLVVACRTFQEKGDRKTFDEFIAELASFRRTSMRYLMLKDWSAFDRFARGFARDRSLRIFLSAAHQFEIFAKTLIREIGKRQVLSDRPFNARRQVADSGEGKK